jgi:predicted TIM-barrel fold metal-dependent hydrolase
MAAPDFDCPQRPSMPAILRRWALGRCPCRALLQLLAACTSCTILTMGADRILFSNDYPYEDYAEGGEFMDTVPTSESDRRKMAYDNAKALYKL